MKTFDCVKMKTKGQMKTRKLLKGKSKQEILDFWRKQTVLFKQQHSYTNSH